MDRRIATLAAALLLGGCECGETPSTSTSAAPSSSATATSANTEPAAPPPRTRRGSTVAVTDEGDAVLVAEEDRGVLWTVPTPITTDSVPRRIAMPGRPAQVLPLRDSILVTIRDPGLLIVLDLEGEEKARVPVRADAWGLAVTADAQTALVSSAWTHQITAVDLATQKVRWTVDVAREPRGIVIPTEGDRAYVTHLVGTPITRLDGLSGDSPKVTRVDLPAAASLSPDPSQVSASLAYSAVLSPKEDRLFVPRLALGAVASWEGDGTVDVMDTVEDEPLAPRREGAYRPTALSEFVDDDQIRPVASWRLDSGVGTLAFTESPFFRQPRAVVYRKRTDSLLVASEGTDEIVELDARWLEPALMPRKRYRLGGGYGKAIVAASYGGAPSGIALSADESRAYVFCRTTSDLAVVPLVAFDHHTSPDDTLILRLAEEDPLLEGLAANDRKRQFRQAAVIGKKLFYNALDERVSGGLACAGCHPEGRDDGHVWIEADAGKVRDEVAAVFVGGPAILKHRHHLEKLGVWGRPPHLPPEGRARQTPMLAGRVRGEGAFGWQGESATLVERIEAGFRLHRWGLSYEKDLGGAGHAGAIASFLLSGLVEPPRPDGEITEEQKRGKAIFESKEAGCTSCHSPEEMFSNWLAVKVKVPGKRAGYADESGEAFKTPSLRFVGGTPPYFHDGSVATLADLVAQNGNRMGKTAHLSTADQKALVAYLETL